MKFSFKRQLFFALAALFWGILAYGQKSGILLSPDSLKASVLTDTTVYTYTTVDVEPYFPGGDERFMKYIYFNISYPKSCMDSAYSLAIYMEFVIEKDGSISNIQSIRKKNVCPGLEEVCKRELSEMPRWIPGRINGKAVRVRCSIPIRFRDCR